MHVEGLLQPTLQQKKVRSTLSQYGHAIASQGIMKEKNTTNVFLAILQGGSNKNCLPYLVPKKAQEPKQGLYIRNVL
jgi:tRNA A22 N-methylase